MNSYNIVKSNGEHITIKAAKHRSVGNTYSFATKDICDQIVHDVASVTYTVLPPTKDEQLEAATKEIAALKVTIANQKKFLEEKDTALENLETRIRTRENTLASVANNIDPHKNDFINPSSELKNLLSHIRNDGISIAPRFSGQLVCQPYPATSLSVCATGGWALSCEPKLGELL